MLPATPARSQATPSASPTSFPEQLARSREELVAPLRDAVADAGGDRTRDADAIYQLAMGRMQDALVRNEAPTADEVAHLVDFALRGMQA